MRTVFSRLRERAGLNSDTGLGLVEIAVAIVLLGIILVGIFPLVVDSVRMAAQNAEVAQANRIVATQLDLARAGVPVTCTANGSAVPGPNPAPIGLTGDDATKFTASRTLSCDAARLAKVTVSVTRISTGTVVATATTKVVTG